jgi:hemerythrin-like domain-containing protein
MPGASTASPSPSDLINMFDQPDQTEDHLHRDGDGGRLVSAADTARAERAAAMHALHVLEYALAAPAPRRHRTWLHRVIDAVEALSIALETHHDNERSLDLLEEVALCHPHHAAQVQRLRREHLDLRIATAALREQIEPDPEIPIDPNDVRNRLAALAERYRQHRAREADLLYTATGIEIDEQDGNTPRPAQGHANPR